MATAAITQQPNGAVAPIPKISVPGKLELSKPWTHKTRRIIANQTDKLIKKRNELDQALLYEVKRGQKGLKHSDWLLRHNILNLSDVLARREAEHVRTRHKWIEEREQLYKWDPSPERKIDLELLQALQWKFKRNLHTHLFGRERSLEPSEADSNTSTDGLDDSDDEGLQDEAVPKSDADCGSSSEVADLNKDDSHEDSSERPRKHSISSLDGAFDDHARENSKKRKFASSSSDLKAKEERRTQAEKEYPTDSQMTTLGSQSFQPSLCSLRFQEEEAEYAGDLAEIDSMSQSKKKLKVYGKKAHIKAKEPDIGVTTAAGVSSEDVSLVKTQIIGNTQLSVTKTSGNQNDSLVEPWYKRHARAMMDPGFNDLVYDHPNRNRKRRRPRSAEYVHGALPEPRGVGSDDQPLPTPPLSSPALSPSSSTQNETKKVDKPQREALVRKDKAQPGKACNSYRPSAAKPSVPKFSASGPSAAASSTQKGPSNAMSAS